MPIALLVTLLLGVVPTNRSEAAAPPDPVGMSLTRGLSRLREGAANYVTNRQCFSCHHQALTIHAFQAARDRGFHVPEQALADQVAFTLATFVPRKAQLTRGQGSPGGNTMVGYALFTLLGARHSADETTAALLEYLLVRQREDGSWPALAPRPPTEGSRFTNAALALQALRAYGLDGVLPRAQRERVEVAFARCKRWLESHQPTTTEDRAFHLRGLVTVGASSREIQAAREKLLGEQQPDGSWAQVPGRKGDAYATATVLLALRQAGVKVEDSAYHKGVRYLLGSQTEQGAWIVSTRSVPVQKFFDNGDPGDRSQFISFAATGWAVLALLETVSVR